MILFTEQKINILFLLLFLSFFINFWNIKTITTVKTNRRKILPILYNLFINLTVKFTNKRRKQKIS